MKKRRMIAALVLLLTLTGCAQTAVQPDFAPAEEKRLVLYTSHKKEVCVAAGPGI